MAAPKNDPDELNAYWEKQRARPGAGVQAERQAAPVRAAPRLHGFVCLECHSAFAPHDYASSGAGKAIAWAVVFLTGVLAVYVAVHGELGEKLGPSLAVLAVGLGIALAIAFYRPRVDYDCKHCGAGRVIPAATPRGAKILSKTTDGTE